MLHALSLALTPAHLRVTVGESIVAALAAAVSALVIDVPVWAMFVGWIAYFTRGVNLRQGLVNLACVLIGLGFGIVAALATSALTPYLGAASLTVVVFALAMVVLSLRLAPVFNNLLGFFLGLVAYFASHLPPSLDAFVELGAAATLGSAAGWLASFVQQRLSKPQAEAV
ncbi:MAG: DUF1097 domain-containing protein [Steroidobacter sp.]